MDITTRDRGCACVFASLCVRSVEGAAPREEKVGSFLFSFLAFLLLLHHHQKFAGPGTSVVVVESFSVVF